jgi:hypothetical protein
MVTLFSNFTTVQQQAEIHFFVVMRPLKQPPICNKQKGLLFKGVPLLSLRVCIPEQLPLKQWRT